MDLHHDNSLLEELFNRYPHEIAVAIRRTKEVGMACDILSMVHCIYLFASAWPCVSSHDFVLCGTCLVWFACLLPSPFFCQRMRKILIEVRCNPAKEVVAQKLIELQIKPRRGEKWWDTIYFSLLASSVAFMGSSVATSYFDEHVGPARKFVALLCFSLAGRFAVRIFVFVRLATSNFDRAIRRDVLDKYSKLVKYVPGTNLLGGGDTDCSICFSTYVEGESIRKLHCGHHYHRECVDPWLLRKQCTCPLCLQQIAPLEKPPISDATE